MTPAVLTTFLLLLCQIFHHTTYDKSMMNKCDVLEIKVFIIFAHILLSAFLCPHSCISVVCQHLAPQLVPLETAGMTKIFKFGTFISTLIFAIRRFFDNYRMCVDSKRLPLLQDQHDDTKTTTSSEEETAPKKITKNLYLIVIYILILIFLSRQDRHNKNKTLRQNRQTRQDLMFIFLRL